MIERLQLTGSWVVIMGYDPDEVRISLEPIRRLLPEDLATVLGSIDRRREPVTTPRNKPWIMASNPADRGGQSPQDKLAELFHAVIKHHGGNIQWLASVLGCHRATITNVMNRGQVTLSAPYRMRLQALIKGDAALETIFYRIDWDAKAQLGPRPR